MCIHQAYIDEVFHILLSLRIYVHGLDKDQNKLAVNETWCIKYVNSVHNISVCPPNGAQKDYPIDLNSFNG